MRTISAAALAVLAFAVTASIAACDSSDTEPDPEPTVVPGGADQERVRVIDEWASTLASGDVKGAARFFAIPSVAENSGTTITITERDDARLFNASLPCGAELERAEAEGEFIVATFNLIERPGPGTCGSGTGETAQTAFLIDEGAIVEWRRVIPSGDQPAPGTPS